MKIAKQFSRFGAKRSATHTESPHCSKNEHEQQTRAAKRTRTNSEQRQTNGERMANEHKQMANDEQTASERTVNE